MSEEDREINVLSQPVNLRMTDLKKHTVHFIKFGVVGSIGTIINLCFFFVAVDLYSLDKNLGNIIAFFLAVTSNYFLNENWTFRKEGEQRAFKINAYVKYVGINIIGLIISIVILNLVDYYFEFTYKIIAQAIGILGAMAFNFISSKLFIFNN